MRIAINSEFLRSDYDYEHALTLENKEGSRVAQIWRNQDKRRQLKTINYDLIEYEDKLPKTTEKSSRIAESSATTHQSIFDEIFHKHSQEPNSLDEAVNIAEPQDTIQTLAVKFMHSYQNASSFQELDHAGKIATINDLINRTMLQHFLVIDQLDNTTLLIKKSFASVFSSVLNYFVNLSRNDTLIEEFKGKLDLIKMFRVPIVKEISEILDSLDVQDDNSAENYSQLIADLVVANFDHIFTNLLSNIHSIAQLAIKIGPKLFEVYNELQDSLPNDATGKLGKLIMLVLTTVGAKLQDGFNKLVFNNINSIMDTVCANCKASD